MTKVFRTSSSSSLFSRLKVEVEDTGCTVSRFLNYAKKKIGLVGFCYDKRMMNTDVHNICRCVHCGIGWILRQPNVKGTFIIILSFECYPNWNLHFCEIYVSDYNYDIYFSI